MNRRRFLGAIAGAPLLGANALGSAVAWLSSRQSGGGGWHSATYGLLRSGHSLTGLVVNALLDSGVAKHDPRIVKAVAFLARNVNPEGALGLSDDDYPCYATALGLRAMVRAGHGHTRPLIDWLKGQQLSPANGWTKAHPAFGAWGIGGVKRQAPDPGHIDLSMTRHVLEALHAAGLQADDPTMADAGVFIHRCRNADGGCFFSTVETGANKAGENGASYLGYGTTTADGVLALHAIGDHAAAAHSLQWLARHDHPHLPQGFGSKARERYAEGLRYYYAESATRAFQALGQRRHVPYAAALEAQQRPDGSWANTESLVKEDDPLIATAFAVSALSLA